MSLFQTEPPPLLLLGGKQNSLAIVRSLGRKNIPVAVAAQGHRPALQSRFCKGRYVIPPDASAESFWGELLLGGSSLRHQARVILACDDFAVTFLAKHRSELERTYILDDFIPKLQLAMLDKQKTLELARSVGCAVPQFWKVETLDALESIRCKLNFPVMIKPIHSHEFERALGKKFFVANFAEELCGLVRSILNRGLKIMVCEIIPGPDSAIQSSYYTYVDRNGEQLLRFTKRVLRRTPALGGQAILHVGQWLPETAEAGERFFRGIGFRGVGHIEFKRDVRDGQLKVIECNPRFTEAQQLLVHCGSDSGYLVYCRLTGRPLPPMKSYSKNVFLWYPIRDVLDQMRGRHGLSTRQWLRSVLHWRTILPYIRLRDPWPSFAMARDELRQRLPGRKPSRTKQIDAPERKENHLRTNVFPWKYVDRVIRSLGGLSRP